MVKLEPIFDEESKHLCRCAKRTGDKIRAMTPKERKNHVQELEYEIAQINQHSYETRMGQARELARQEALGLRYRG